MGDSRIADGILPSPVVSPENLNGDLHGTGFLSVDLPRLVDELGSGSCELVSFRHALACAIELVETACLAFHCSGDSSTERVRELCAGAWQSKQPAGS